MLRHRLDIVAPTMVRAVQFAGGWLFDRVMEGWDVAVHVTDHADPRPLRILGARAVDLEVTLAARSRAPHPQALAVDAEFYYADSRVRRLVGDAVGQRLTDVRFWGDWRPADLPGDNASMQHRLSVAARAFKAQALAAAAAPVASIELVELFRSSEGTTCPARPDALQPAELS